MISFKNTETYGAELMSLMIDLLTRTEPWDDYMYLYICRTFWYAF